MVRRAALTLALILATPTAALAGTDPGSPSSATAPLTEASGATFDEERSTAVPALRVTRKVRGLSTPWDVQPLPKGRLLISERDNRRLLVWRAGRKTVLSFPSRRVWVSGETGLMSVAVDPEFPRNRRVYTCQGWITASGHDVRVIAWRMNGSYTGVRRIKVLVRGIPSTTGQHGGCRLLISRAGALLVGTGDAAVGSTPQDLRSLGGKVLRLNRFTGRPHRKNPWPGAASVNRRYVLTYGHRNVQGLAQRSDGTLWSAEHGPDRDDEVNRLVAGGNYGWNPVPGYNQTVPMTDHGLPGTQVEARWRSGIPTVATSGAVWVRGRKWGAYNGTLAVATLKGSRLLFMKFDSSGNHLWTRTPPALTRFGRLRSVTRAPNNNLLVTTSNGTNDVVLRVRPR